MGRGSMEADAGAAGTPEEARRRIARAVERARAEGRRVLVVFGADWCPDAKAFEQSLQHPVVAPLVAMGLEVVRLDVGNRDRLTQIAAAWDIDYAAGIPAVVVLDADGEVVTATRHGELRTARTLSPIQIATHVHRWLPEGAGPG